MKLHHKKTMKRYIYFQLLAAVALFLSACVNHPDVPSSSKEAKCLPAIFPDYCDVTVPCNIAPLNFMLPADEYEACIARFTTSDGQQQTYGDGVKVMIPESEWQSMLSVSKGKGMKVEVWGKKGDEWLSFQPFEIRVAEEPIDEYISYRLIEPSYVAWSFMEISQRNLTSFEETQIFNNEITSIDREKGQCINCHSYQNYKTDNMLFHVRLANGGTVIVNDGKVSRVNMKRDYTISSGVYPAWHPTAKLIAFSTNKTRQGFHTLNPNKIEVYDLESDLILYDVERHEVTTIEQQPNELEIFPSWSPDGRWLYFCSAHFEYKADSVDLEDITLRAKELKYNIYRKAFDPTAKTFGERELVFAADSLGMSATFPRLSPDGRWLLFTMGEWGCFHIWHHDADLWMMDLRSEKGIVKSEEFASARPLTEANSDDTESYHSWSSNGRWVVFSSRRYDGIFTRPFFVHIDKEGHAGKPFELPTRDPDRHRQLLKSYNVPEFMKGRVTLTPQQAASELKEDGSPITYKNE